MKAELFTRENISSIVWPSTADGEYARRYLLPMMIDGAQEFIKNAHTTQLLLAKVDGLERKHELQACCA